MEFLRLATYCDFRGNTKCPSVVCLSLQHGVASYSVVREALGRSVQELSIQGMFLSAGLLRLPYSLCS